jgi:hypothetical protein
MTLKPKPGIGTPSGNAADTGGAPSASLPSSHRQNYHQQLSDKLGELDMNAAPSQLELRGEDLEDVRELGAGNGGSVKQVIHRPTNMSMAKKVRPRRQPPKLHLTPRYFVDYPHRRKTFCQEADSQRTADHARLQFQLHHLLLRCIHC